MTESEDSRAPVPKRGSSAMTEPERLRGEARRSLEFADAIADQEAARALKAYAAELAPGGRADRGKGGRRRRGEHGGGTGRSGGEHDDSHVAHDLETDPVARGSSPTMPSPVAGSRASSLIFPTSGRNGWSCCERSYPGSRASRCCGIRPAVSRSSKRCRRQGTNSGSRREP